MCELTRQAHGVNLDLGAALLNDLAAVAPDNIDVARFFAYGVLGPPSTNYLAYGDPDVAMKWLWRFIDGAKSAGELYGRVLVVFAAQHYACQLALPTAKRRGSVLPRSHNDTARKAFEKITKTILPASYAQLQRALSAEAKTYRQRVDKLDHPPAAPRDAAAAVNVDEPADEGQPQDLDEHAEPAAA